MAAPVDPLFEAIRNNEIEDVIRILGEETVEEGRLGVALFEALQQENASMVESLLSANAPLGLVNIGDGETTALHVASSLGHLEVVEMLIDIGSNPNTKDSGEYTPLHNASYFGHIPVISKLLDSGMDIESPGSEGRTPLIAALDGDQIDAIHFLLDRGANVNASDSDGVSCLMFACGTAGKTPDPAIIRLLIGKGANIEARTLDSCLYEGYTPLMYAVVHPDANTSATAVAGLIAAGANLEANNRTAESTALHLSIGNSSLGAYKLLLDAGANVQAVGNNGSTIWHYLGRIFDKENLDEWVELLLSTGLSINSKNSHGYTPLYEIVNRVTFDPSNELDRRAPRALEVFLKAGADATALDNNENSLLHFLILKFYTMCCSTSAQLNDPTWPDKCRSAAQFIRMLAVAGAMPVENLDASSPLRQLKNWMGEATFNQHRNRLAPLLVALVAAGDHNCFDLLPRNAPLPGLGAALIDVWRNNQAKLRYLFARLSNENQERVRLLLKCLRFGSLGQGGSRTTQNASSLPEELRIQIISYALAS